MVASAYGAKDLAELCGAIESGFISKYAIGCAAGGERGRWDSLVGFAKDTGISFLGKKDQGSWRRRRASISRWRR